jgi:hypothetical protein
MRFLSFSSRQLTVTDIGEVARVTVQWLGLCIWRPGSADVMRVENANGLRIPAISGVSLTKF